MKSREPAGWERGGGSSAESPVQAWAGDGPGGKTSGTVRGFGPRGCYPLTEPSRRPGVYAVGRSAVSAGFFYTTPPLRNYIIIWRTFK